jgi:hypothetical protein
MQSDFFLAGQKGESVRRNSISGELGTEESSPEEKDVLVKTLVNAVKTFTD